ncbi:MAG: prolipoprotein diacylglyceryl transferase [Peptococcaceae bacterium]|jgi:phosphatidylglycerol:prolipoprotein diacylglycerol transferase|nr:prolipoprotein diacylglyceryl transferase [Peptococcaceae bacterium]
MHQYWFYIGSFPVRAYGTIFILAFICGILVSLYIFKAEGKAQYSEHLINMSVWLLLAGIVGARFWQVFFFDWPFYSRHLGQIVAIWHGGLSIQGGVVGALIAGWLYMRKHHLPFWEIADLLAPGLILAQSVGRDANFMNGDAFGLPTHAKFGLLYPPGTLAFATFGHQPLWPAEVWEGQADLILFVLLVVLLRWRKLPDGYIFLAYVILYNIERFFLEMLRGDSPRFLFGWTAAQWTALPAILLSLAVAVGLAYYRRTEKA